MEFRTGVILVTLLCVLRSGALVRFPFTGAEGEAEVVYLPPLKLQQAPTAYRRSHDVPQQFTFDAFGRTFELQLVPNRRLLAPGFQVWSERGQEVPLSTVDSSCHFLNKGRETLAALSACQDPQVLQGLIMVDNSTFEIYPLAAGRRATYGPGLKRIPYQIRRATPPSPLNDDLFIIPPKLIPRRKSEFYGNRPKTYTIELALFVDTKAYTLFYTLFNNNEADLRDMLLAYVNGVQAMYQHESLGKHIQLSLVRMTLLRNQPPQLTTESNFYAIENGKRNDYTLGLTTTSGICYPPLNCAMVELGVTDISGNPFPSAGFSSIYIMAHEIGHSLGMGHDGIDNGCSSQGYIMSPSRGFEGEVTWSSCSAKEVSQLQWATCLYDGDEALENTHEYQNHPFDGMPGITIWTAKKQCELFLRNIDATPYPSVPTAEICTKMTCLTADGKKTYAAGPAISGTTCGINMYCLGGKCVPMARPLPELTNAASRASDTEASSTQREAARREAMSSKSGEACPV